MKCRQKPTWEFIQGKEWIKILELKPDKMESFLAKEKTDTDQYKFT